jgi:hypothetical protein
MIRKSGYRFSDKIMLHPENESERGTDQRRLESLPTCVSSVSTALPSAE